MSGIETLLPFLILIEPSRMKRLRIVRAEL